MKGRFAPSPSGRMHLGNIYAALLSWLSVRKQGGTWLLRIEDLDPQRCKMQYALQIEDDLRWLGLTWDEGGTENKGINGPYVQSQRSDIYEYYLHKLEQTGLTYPCTCTRADILATQAPHESDGRVVYKGTCRPKNLEVKSIELRVKNSSYFDKHNINSANGSTNDTNPNSSLITLNSSLQAATRLFVPNKEISFTDGNYGPQSVNIATHCGDFVLRRKDGAWAYQLAVVVDDALMGVTEVVRGCDLLLSVPQQLYLFDLLGFTPPKYFHIPLLCNEQGQRLCKRDKSMDMGILRENYTPEKLLGMIAYRANIISSDEPISLKELLEEYNPNDFKINNIK